MLTCKLGRSGIDIPKLVLGGNVFGWTADRALSFQILDAALAAGLSAIDTADVYARWVPGNTGGESETILGEWMAARGNRNSVVIATKVGAAPVGGHKGLSRAGILQGIDDSLRRLRTDRVDLYQSHRDDGTVSLEETLQAFADLVAAGKVRAVGASNYTGSRLAEALAISATGGLPRFETIQPHYNLVERHDFETDLAPVALREGLTVIPYYSLASGFLTGKYRSKADIVGDRGEAVSSYMNPSGEGALAALDDVAQRRGATPAQVALAWLMARPGTVAPIASASKPEQVADLARACELVLDAADIRLLDDAGT